MKFQENSDISSLVENTKYVYLDEDNVIIYILHLKRFPNAPIIQMTPDFSFDFEI